MLQTVIGVFMILNLFIAMLMHAFEEASDEVKRNKDLKDAADLPPSNTPSQTDLSTTVDNEESEEERKRKAAMLQIKVHALLSGHIRSSLSINLPDNAYANKKEISKSNARRSLAVRCTFRC